MPKFIIDMPDKFNKTCGSCPVPNCGGLMDDWEVCPLTTAKLVEEVEEIDTYIFKVIAEEDGKTVKFWGEITDK